MPLKGHKVVLELGGLKIGPLRKLVDFLYTSEMEVTCEEAQDVLAAAQQLQVSELESLQLEGGKLVKKGLGRRLNRECLQLSALSIPEANLMQSPPCCSSSSSTTFPLITSEQPVAVKLPCIKGTGNDSGTVQKETSKQKPAAMVLCVDRQPTTAAPSATTESLRTKVKKLPTSPAMVSGDILVNEGHGTLHIEQARARDEQVTVNLEESKKIKLSRSKLASPSPPTSYATKGHSTIASTEISRSSRRLWRQKSPSDTQKAKEVEPDNHLQDCSSHSCLPKAMKGRKRSSSEPVPSSNPSQEPGQIGRVKLRKIINGSCWEVVQEPPAPQPMAAINSVCALAATDPLLQPKQDTGETQQRACCRSPGLLPTKLAPAPPRKRNAGKEDEKTGDPYQQNLFMLEEPAETKHYDNLASAGELERMLGLLLVDDNDATGGHRNTIVPESMPTSGPAEEANKSVLGRTGTAGESSGETDVSAERQWVKTENRSRQGEQEAADLKLHKQMPDYVNRDPLVAPVCGYLALETAQPRKDCIAFGKLASPHLDGWTDQQQLLRLESDAVRPAEALPILLSDDEDQELQYCGGRTSGAEPQPHTQELLRSHLQHDLNCKLLPILASLEEEEIDVGEVEEFFCGIECVRPDSSPISETEVDVLN